MDIQFYGGNCISISNKQIRVVIDDNLQDLGAKPTLKEGNVALYTGPHGAPAVSVQLLVDHPGEYEVRNVSIYGIALRGHMDVEGKKSVTAYKVVFDDVRFLITGHIYPALSERELETIGTVDVMFVPVGGYGYTTDPAGALKLIKTVEPKLVIPTHFHDDTLAFPVPQQTLEQALTTIGMEPKETTDKLRIKSGDTLEGMQLTVLTRA